MWSSQPIQIQGARFFNENIITLRPGAIRYAKTRVDVFKDAFPLFHSPPTEYIILKHFNAYAKAKYGEGCQPIDSNLLQAYVGVLILAGVYSFVILFIFSSKNEKDLFGGEYFRPILKAIMSKKTF